MAKYNASHYEMTTTTFADVVNRTSEKDREFELMKKEWLSIIFNVESYALVLNFISTNAKMDFKFTASGTYKQYRVANGKTLTRFCHISNTLWGLSRSRQNISIRLRFTQHQHVPKITHDKLVAPCVYWSIIVYDILVYII